MNFQEARSAWADHRAEFLRRGITMPLVQSYVPDEWSHDYALAMDAQPQLFTDPNSAVPALFTTMVDPKVFRGLFAPNKMAEIKGEQREGTWVMDTLMLPVTEAAGEVAAYGDFAENGHATANVNYPQRQAFLFQVIKEYGERELERAGLARISWVTELDYSAALMLNKFSNLTYAFGVAGLQNYGLLNDPHLNASLTPSIKAAGGTAWVNASNVIVATANEIFLDIESLFIALVNQTAGILNRESKVTLALSPISEMALTATNSFGVNVSTLLKLNFPSIRVISAIQYQALSASNPQGVAGGNFAQLIADDVEGMETGYCGFNEKMRAHKLIPAMSSFKQKVSAGTWGCILRQTAGIASMIGI